jgi:hypothetical protein
MEHKNIVFGKNPESLCYIVGLIYQPLQLKRLTQVGDVYRRDAHVSHNQQQISKSPAVCYLLVSCNYYTSINTPQNWYRQAA